MDACVPGLGDILGLALILPLVAVLVVAVVALCRIMWKDI